MKNIMKKVVNNDLVDIFEFNATNKDIVNITLIEKARIVHKDTQKEYLNGTFLQITNRKGDTRILDLVAHADITEIFKNFEIQETKKTKIKPIFIGQ